MVICNYTKILLCLTETYNIIIVFKFTPVTANGDFNISYWVLSSTFKVHNFLLNSEKNF
jgi:hypothetical protein